MKWRRAIALLAFVLMGAWFAAPPALASGVMLDDFEDADVAGWSINPNPLANGCIEAVAAPQSPSGGDYVGKVVWGGS